MGTPLIIDPKTGCVYFGHTVDNHLVVIRALDGRTGGHVYSAMNGADDKLYDIVRSRPGDRVRLVFWQAVDPEPLGHEARVVGCTTMVWLSWGLLDAEGIALNLVRPATLPSKVGPSATMTDAEWRLIH